MNWYNNIKIAVPLAQMAPGETYFDIWHKNSEVDTQLWFIDTNWQLHTHPSFFNGRLRGHLSWDEFAKARNTDSVLARGNLSSGRVSAIIEWSKYRDVNYQFILGKVSKILDQAFDNPEIKDSTYAWNA